AQGNCKKSISLVRLALFCVMVCGLGPNLAALGPKWTQVFSRNWADGRQARGKKSVVFISERILKLRFVKTGAC
ncbi:MAG: hypothetical protein ACREBW_06265, partial [Candidatus Micrarchaeaceae archaeon]